MKYLCVLFRNEALYKAVTTAPIVIPTTASTTPAPTTAATPRPRRRRPYRRRRPAYEYYYDDQYDDDEYYDDDPPPPRRKANRKHRPQGLLTAARPRECKDHEQDMFHATCNVVVYCKATSSAILREQLSTLEAYMVVHFKRYNS